MHLRYLRILTTLIACACSLTVHAKVFECAFLQDKYASGKPNKASCSMLPEIVFSDKWHTPKKNEHCKVDTIHAYRDIEDVIIDTESGSVTWKTRFGLIDEAKPRQKKYYIEKGDSEEEAEKKVNSETEKLEYFKIKSYHVSQQNIRYDEVTRSFRESPKKALEHNLMFTDGNGILYLYIPEASWHAILFEPNGMTGSSWVGMRFGRCRLKQ